MYEMTDPFEGGTPKYSTAQDIYEALCELVMTEEMNILSEIGVDVSYENQGYYYTDKGVKLKEEFEQLSDNGNKMWLIDLAILQADQNEIHDLVYEALINPDLAKRIGFKQLFVDHMLNGDNRDYAEITEEWLVELQDLDRFDNMSMIRTFNKVMNERGRPQYVTPYPTFAYYLIEKIRNLKLEKEVRLIAECRAHLTAYDDFIFGLKANQYLYKRQEQAHRHRMAELQAAYEQKLNLLLAAAEKVGLLPALKAELELQQITQGDGPL